MITPSGVPPRAARISPRVPPGIAASLIAVALLLAPPRGAAAAGMAAARPATIASVADAPRPHGYYVLNEAGNNRTAARAYATGLTTSTGYLQHVTGHAIYVPIAKILPRITTWGQFDWKWGYLDTLVQVAVSHGKLFSIELETGIQNVGTNYLQSLPDSFAATCGADCAPLFDVWVSGAPPGTCTSSYILLPWKPRVQQFWALAAESLAAHLHDIGAYGSLTLVHVPGLSVYDDELRLPDGIPAVPAADSTVSCPDGRPAYPTSNTDADISHWLTLGYSDSVTLAGFGAIASAFANAFPDRVLGLSLFPARAFPNLTSDSVGFMPSQIVQEVSALAPGRVQLQADDLDIGTTWEEVLSFAPQYATAIGWQSNKHGGTGATCGADTCGPDVEDSPYFQLLETGALARGHYVEIWSSDVVKYPNSLAEADSAGYYSLASAPPAPRPDGALTRLLAVWPNPARGGVRLTFALARGAPAPALVVVDVSGRRVRTLTPAGAAGAGLHQVTWDGLTDRGAPAPAGVYFATLRSGATAAGRVGFVLLR